ncbi:unnamed protein product [Rotaria sordida]|uniref:Uncharacterized protein n=1 Tax=Rotaria sordida TaxID=392033 RepID=A0A815HUL4_9BILA|nr:unnamed protein product [Rotaria sordida]CAF1606033.1 unnamed protein product [Rotaria sordida]
MSLVIQLQESETHVYIYPSSLDDDKQLILQSCSSSSSEHNDSIKEILPNHRKILFDKVLGEMLTRHFYLIQHEFLSSDRFEGWIYTYNRHRYKIIISYHSSCSQEQLLLTFKRQSIDYNDMSVTNNFKRKTFAGQNSPMAQSNGTQIKRPKRYDNLNILYTHQKKINLHCILT